MANIDIVGADGAIAWTTLVSGTTAPATTRATVVRANIRRGTYPTTRPGSLMQRVAVTELRGEVTIRVVVTDDGTPPIPVSTVGLLTITSKSAQNVAFKVVIVAIGGIGYNSLTGEPQFQDYECVACSTLTTDTVTAT